MHYGQYHEEIMKVIGREKEKVLLKQITSSKNAEFVAIYGRRRVGKTYLIQQCLSKKGVYLECTGLKDGNLHDQLTNFIKSFQEAFYPNLSLKTPKSWNAAFELLTREIKSLAQTKKIIIFLDEIPWLATKKSRLLQNLDYFWNTQWSKIPSLKLIVCGSAASWMLNKLINATGGLYNRLTKTILLEPFTLGETKQYLNNLGMSLTEKQVLDLYMVFGGIPYYLNHIHRSKSVAQNINDICFKKTGLLFSEFPRLFKSLFDAADVNLMIVKALAKYRYGISFKELIKKIGKTAGGRCSERLAELEAAGFVQRFLPYGRKRRDHYYKIADEYTMFYLKWISEVVDGKEIPKSSNYWIQISNTQAWQSWAGYAFEGICQKHADKIVSKLGLSSIGCFIGNWRCVTDPKSKDFGAQVDLLFDRQDDAITMCEIKYAAKLFSLDKTGAKKLINKLEVFQKQTKTRKQLFLVMLTTLGLKRNIWSEDLIDADIKLQDLF